MFTSLSLILLCMMQMCTVRYYWNLCRTQSRGWLCVACHHLRRAAFAILVTAAMMTYKNPIPEDCGCSLLEWMRKCTAPAAETQRSLLHPHCVYLSLCCM